MPRIPANEVKQRTKKLTDFFYTYQPYDNKLGEIQEVLVTEVSHDKKHYVGHNKFYEQVLVPMREEYMGKLVQVEIVETSKFSMKGQPTQKRATAPGLSKPLLKGEVSGAIRPEKVSKIIYAFMAVLVAILFRFIWILL